MYSSSRCPVCMLSHSSCQSWQDVGVQDFLKLLADALLYWHHSCFKRGFGDNPCWIGVITDVEGAEVPKWLKHLSSSLYDKRMQFDWPFFAMQKLGKEYGRTGSWKSWLSQAHHMIKRIGAEQLQQLCMSLPHGHNIVQPFTQSFKELVFVPAVLVMVRHPLAC